MRVLVTGAGGFAGRHLVGELLKKDGLVVGGTFVPDSPPFARDGQESDVVWIPMDVSSLESVRDAVRDFQPDVIYHLAGQASVSRSFEAPLATWDVNAIGTLRVALVLSELPDRRRMLLVSSAEVYGAVSAEAQPISEDSPCRPETPYGSSKAAAELAALQVARASALEVVIARSFNHIGPGQDERFVLPGIARQLTDLRRSRGSRTLHVGNLAVERDFLDVRDVVQAYVRLMDHGDNGRVYNVCSGVSTSLRTIVERMIALSGTDAVLEVDPERFRPVDIPVLVGDPARLRSLGWAARSGLDATLADILDEALRSARLPG